MSALTTRITILVLLTSGQLIWAQKPPGPTRSEGLSRQEIEAYRKSLNITAAQKQRLKQLEQQYARKTGAVLAKYQPEEERLRKTKGGGTREERFAIESRRAAEMKPIVAAYQKAMAAVYTSDQRRKMQAFQARNRALLLKSLSKSKRNK